VVVLREVMGNRNSTIVLLIAALLLVIRLSDVAHGQEVKAQPATAEAIKGWIADLDSREYKTRESASRRLAAAGPAALDPLLAEANSSRVESSDRAISILWQLSQSSDSELSVSALTRLVNLVDRNSVASKAADRLSFIRHQQAANAIKQLGGQIAPYQVTINDPRLMSVQVIIDSQWKGGDQGLALLNDIRGLRRISILGTDISYDGLASLEGVRSAEAISLYGTRLSSDEVTKLRTLMPNTTFDVRRGGLLGIHGDAAPNQFVQVLKVQPDGAAAKAGIQAGDIITHLNQQELKNFQSLVEKVGELPAGDEVLLRINREGKEFEQKVRLGHWRSEDLLPKTP
jgi:membrane-associated protease RseP (regulator of RpoE activity)